MTRAELTEKILGAKLKKGISWPKLAEKIGRSPVWTTAALMGQMPLSADEAKSAGTALGLTENDVTMLQIVPTRGSLGAAVPVDPTIYRFYELIQVYGTAWKELIHEEFGDGIMSAIDFEMTMERMPDPKGDRVKIVMHGKFLPYRKY
ncbi:MAG: cyanase [Burkholderiales bacterium]|nr:cyanase [Burkholderiales bacterium]MDQ3195608.1 cyanase [Pseudomonadota bacterium]